MWVSVQPTNNPVVVCDVVIDDHNRVLRVIKDNTAICVEIHSFPSPVQLSVDSRTQFVWQQIYSVSQRAEKRRRLTFLYLSRHSRRRTLYKRGHKDQEQYTTIKLRFLVVYDEVTTASLAKPPPSQPASQVVVVVVVVSVTTNPRIESE